MARRAQESEHARIDRRVRRAQEFEYEEAQIHKRDKKGQKSDLERGYSQYSESQVFD
jgi:hypothetical protein